MLPGIVPRARRFLSSGFGYVAYLMACIYNMVRLLPQGHPYLDPQNIGRFGVRHVVGEAANNLVISRKNIDQMVVFVALLAGVIIMVMQFVLLLYGYVIQPALAQSLFDTPSPERDIAFLLLDNVFGVPGLFCNAGGVCTEIAATLPFPFHEALHDLLAFYSTGLLLVAVFIFLYFVVVLVGETATTGSPFGKRFQNVWAPIRLVVALGLLVPVHYGLNSAQYITLYAAKYGSGFATNGWLRFNNALADHGLFGGGGANPSGEYASLLALPQMPDIAPTVQYMSLMHACRYAYWRLGSPDMGSSPLGPGNDFEIKPYLVKQPQPWMSDTGDYLEVTSGTTYVRALDFYHNSDIMIVFGERREGNDGYKDYPGYVKPICGQIRIQTSDLSQKGTDRGTDKIQNAYFELVKTLAGIGGGGAPGGASSHAERLKQMSYRFMEISLPMQPEKQCEIGCDSVYELPSCSGGSDAPCHTVMPSIIVKQEIINDLQGYMNPIIKTAWQDSNEDAAQVEIPEEMKERGWGGAGIWYNTVAKLNGSFISAVINVPMGARFPLVMEDVRMQKLASDRASSMVDQFRPNLSDGEAVDLGNNDDLIIAKSLYDMMVYWYNDGLNQDDPDKAIIGNIFEVTMNFIFGTEGLFAMRGENAHIHPLSQLTALGKGLVDRTLINVGISMGVATGIFEFAGFDPRIVKIAGSVVSATAFVGLTAGLVLFYVLPFLPFVYFYFAVGQWVKEIFEAMVGAPLWALAHMRIDGEGLPGDAASNGYFLIFEIFVRPIMIVMGLVAAMVIFTAQVRVLNFTWTLVVDNLTGFEIDSTLPPESRIAQQQSPRGVIDQFFFTIIYTIIVYMLAMASFKLIDSIPDNILRWMGAGVGTFADTNKEEPAQSLSRYTAISGMTLGRQAVEATQQLAGGLGSIVGLKPKPGQTQTQGQQPQRNQQQPAQPPATPEPGE
jgi:conjugal transfer/type IV secretion protein DotA/TraY